MDILSVTQTLIDRARLFRQVVTVVNILPNENYFSDSRYICCFEQTRVLILDEMLVLIYCSYFFQKGIDSFIVFTFVLI